MDGGNRRLLAIERIVPNRPPRAIGTLRGIGDHGMGMKLGIAVAREIMGEQGGHHAVGLHRRLRSSLVVEPPRLDQVPLHPAQGCLDAGVKGGEQAAIISKQRHQ